jgi:hypothetical protein
MELGVLNPEAARFDRIVVPSKPDMSLRGQPKLRRQSYPDELLKVDPIQPLVEVGV